MKSRQLSSLRVSFDFPVLQIKAHPPKQKSEVINIYIFHWKPPRALN